jgi:hypothetical protein
MTANGKQHGTSKRGSNFKNKDKRHLPGHCDICGKPGARPVDYDGTTSEFCKTHSPIHTALFQGKPSRS